MDTFGLQTAAPAQLANRRRLRRLLAAGLAAPILVAGCASGPLELGRPLPLDRLSQLKPGASSVAEVIATLGEPQGRGKGLLPTAPNQDVLLYESDTMDGTKMRMRMLIVYVTRPTGLYEGYMWFSSGSIVSKTK